MVRAIGVVVMVSSVAVVVQGFSAEFGQAGVARFFASTDGWDTPILNDRAAPRYPRAQVLSAHDRRLVDDWIGTVGARLVNDGCGTVVAPPDRRGAVARLPAGAAVFRVVEVDVVWVGGKLGGLAVRRGVEGVDDARVAAAVDLEVEG